jgi:hypothetical protein
MTLTFYTTQIQPEYNGIYENIESYLKTLTPTLETEYKSFGVFSVNETVKIPVSYIKASRVGTTVGNYCRADDASGIYYYFVTGAERRGSETVQFTLVMDTLTTFQSDYSLDDRTHITRKFFDRWVADYDKGIALPTINNNAESFQVPQFLDSETKYQGDTILSNSTWYLITQSQSTTSSSGSVKSTDGDSENTVSYTGQTRTSLFYTLVPGTSTTAWRYVSTNTDLTPDNFPEGWYVITSEEGHAGSVQGFRNGTATGMYTLTGNVYIIIAKQKNGKLTMQLRYIEWNGGLSSDTGDLDEIKLTGFGDDQYMYRQSGDYPWLSTWYKYEELSWAYPLSIYSGDEGTITLNSFDVWYAQHGADSNIVRIVQLPYCPVAMPVIDHVLYPRVQNKVCTITTSAIYLPQGINFKTTLPTYTFEYPTLAKSDINLSHGPRYNCETKLLNSAYQRYSLDYDVNSFPIRPELLQDIQNPEYYISMYASSDSSNFGFKITSGQLKEQPGEDYFIANRNNEVPYFNDEYLNYTRYGKAADREKLLQDSAQSIVSGIGTGVSTAGSIALIAKGGAAAAGGPVGWVVGGISAAVGLATTAISLSTKLTSDANSIASKEAQLGNAGLKQSTATDATLYAALGQQTMFLRHYKPKEETYKMLFDYFRLYGYACDVYERPDSTRYWTDFFQCEPSFRGQLWQEIKDDLTARWKMGVVVYHWHDSYDFYRSKENWEDALVEWSAS